MVKRLRLIRGMVEPKPGAIGINGMKEKELNLAVALKVENALKPKGYSSGYDQEKR